MPFPYNVFLSVPVWIAGSYSSYGWRDYEDSPIVWMLGDLPTDFWNMYYAQGIPNWPNGIWYHPNVWPNYLTRWGGYRINNAGCDLDKENGILSFYQMYESIGNNMDCAWWNNYMMQMANFKVNSLNTPEIINLSNRMIFNDGTSNRTLTPCMYNGGMRYVYTKDDPKNSVLAIAEDYGFLGISHDNGENFNIIIPDHVDHVSYPDGMFCVTGGPPGSNTILWGSYNDLFVTQDYLTSFITLQTAGPGSGIYHIENNPTGDIKAHACNLKKAPDTVWVAIGAWRNTHYDSGDGLGKSVRNLTTGCEVTGWETHSIPVVSQAFEDDLYEGTVFYPADYWQESVRGTNRKLDWWATSLKYVNGKFWLLNGPDIDNTLPFSEDDGLTWSKILCDHLNASNWKSMHPFFSPRLWPWSESWALHVSMNYSGGGAVMDIESHPDDPDILVSIGSFWLKDFVPCLDPAGRDHIWPEAIVEPLNIADPVSIEIMNNTYHHYLPGQIYESVAYGAISISMDNGVTWGKPISTSPRWTIPPARTGGYGVNKYPERIWACR